MKTTIEWLKEARDNREKLVSLIKSYHPVNRQPGRRSQDHITAPNAEMACTVVRKQIRENFEGDPVKEFNEALDTGDIPKIYRLLDQTWFGVPETTSCWRIDGFREAVDLMDDMPE